MLVLLKKEEEYKRIYFSELSSHLDFEMFNPLVKNLKELRTNWLIPVRESELVK